MKSISVPILIFLLAFFISGKAQFVYQPINSAPALRGRIQPDTLTWHRPRFSERRKERLQMVKDDISKQGVTDPKVLDAMRHVPRHMFVPEKYQKFAYQNSPIPIGHGQTISQPYIVAYMTQVLDLKTGEKVLEIGTGSGYQAAVLSEITPYVYTIEIIPDLANEAMFRFEKLGYATIKTKIGDGYNGWTKYAPFDAIILTAAAEQIPPPLMKQLKPGGIMVMPIGDISETQELTKVTKTKDGKIHIERKIPVRFVPMRGENQEGGNH
ncbi:MAG TPA: protein-L-isoaspartate(D-aspartate) O-methyltransferase [Balneolaceae bacterium]|nr:protein-L-isoaspartate(D-aspartate) O-methyltransferase [Balneolaceae bacterium]